MVVTYCDILLVSIPGGLKFWLVVPKRCGNQVVTATGHVRSSWHEGFLPQPQNQMQFLWRFLSRFLVALNTS